MHTHTHAGLHQLNSLAHLFLLMQQIKLLYRQRKHTRDTVLWQNTQPKLLSSGIKGNSCPEPPTVCNNPNHAGSCFGGRTCGPKHMAIIKISLCKDCLPQQCSAVYKLSLSLTASGQPTVRAVCSQGGICMAVLSVCLDHLGNAEEALNPPKSPLFP